MTLYPMSNKLMTSVSCVSVHSHCQEPQKGKGMAGARARAGAGTRARAKGKGSGSGAGAWTLTWLPVSHHSQDHRLRPGVVGGGESEHSIPQRDRQPVCRPAEKGTRADAAGLLLLQNRCLQRRCNFRKQKMAEVVQTSVRYTRRHNPCAVLQAGVP